MNSHVPARLGRACLVLLGLLAAALTLSLPAAAPAHASAGFKVSIEGDEIVISGDLYHRGARSIDWGLVAYHNRSGSQFGLHCGSYPIDAHHDHTVLKVPFKQVPNGKWRMIEISTDSGGGKIYTDPGPWFHITISPAVSVSITKGPSGTATSSPVRYTFQEMGAIAKTQCSVDGGTWRGCSSPASYDALPEGKHSFTVRVIGKNSSYRQTEQRAFLLDTKPPTAPTVSGGTTGWSQQPADLTASGSTDHGSGVDHYQFRISTDGGSTWSTPADGNAYGVTEQGTTLVGFRAVDGVGHTSPWTTTTVQYDWRAPSTPTIAPGACPSPAFPVTLTAAATDNASGIDHYTWDIARRDSATGTDTESTSTGSSVTLDQPGEYSISVQAYDRAGNVGDIANWSNAAC